MPDYFHSYRDSNARCFPAFKLVHPSSLAVRPPEPIDSELSPPNFDCDLGEGAAYPNKDRHYKPLGYDGLKEEKLIILSYISRDLSTTPGTTQYGRIYHFNAENPLLKFRVSNKNKPRYIYPSNFPKTSDGYIEY